MKIGIFDPYLDTLGGGERYMLSAASCLSKDHSVVLFWDDMEIVSAARDKLGISLDNVTIKPTIFAKKVNLFTRLAVTRNFDRIIFLSDGGIPFVLAKKLLVHFQFPVPWVKISSLFDKLKIRRVHRVVCNSAYTKHHIDQTFNVRSRVLYPPVMFSTGKGLVSNKENIILSVGSLAKLPEGGTFKKFEFMIGVFKSMIDMGEKDWRLVLVVSPLKRDTGYVEELRSSSSSYPITILENVSYNALQDLYGKAKIYWHAAGYGEDLLKNPQRAEHFGITTVEAMGYGAVPIVINAGGQREIVEDGKSGYLWSTEEELIAKTISLMQDVKLWENISKHAKERAIMFSVEKFCQELKRLII